MKIVVASTAQYLRECVASLAETEYADATYQYVSDQSELVRHLIDRQFKLVIITDDFDNTINYEKLFKSYANPYNYIVFATDSAQIDVDQRSVKVLDQSVSMEELREVFRNAYIIYERSMHDTPPQIDAVQVIGVWSINPRNLKTTISQNLALMLAQGDISNKIIYVGIGADNPTLPHIIKTDTNTFDVLIPTTNGGVIDPTVLSASTYVYPEHPNLHVLSGIEDRSLFHKIDDTFIESLITALREEYKYIILDIGSSLYSIPNVVALQNCDLTVNIVDKDISSFLHGWPNVRQLLKSFGISINNMVTMINEFYPNPLYTSAKVSSHVGLYNIGVIPNMGTAVMESMIKRKALFSGGTQTEQTKQFREVLSTLYSYIKKEKPKAKKNWFVQMLGG
ncbi:hypothetical protein D3C78_18540 [compost metagenome]